MDPTWEEHKDEIERLYIKQDKPRKEVMKILREKRNFNTTKKQYETAIKKWGFRKYKFSPEKWKVVNRKIQKRKRELGKENEVHVDGIPYPPEKVRVGISKHGFLPMAELYSVPSPEMPEGINVCSPIPVTTLQWPRSLPWFQFLKIVEGKESQFSPTSLSSAIDPMNCHQHPLATQDVTQSLLSFQNPKSQNKSKMDRVSRLTQTLELIMPEEREGEHRTTSEVLSGHRIDVGLQERFKLLFYLLSNNISLIGDDVDERDVAREDELIINILRSSRLNTKDYMKYLLAMPGLTPAVIAEKIFQSAVRSADRETITAMPGAGMDPQTLIAFMYSNITPLEYFSRIAPSVEMASLLLSHNADVNKYIRSPVLSNAILEQDKDLINLFVFHGADISFGLENLMSRSDNYGRMDWFDILKPFLISMPNTNIREPEKVLKEMLQLSIRSRNVEWLKMLLSRGADPNSLHKVKFEDKHFQTTALGLAAQQDTTDMIQALYKAGATVNPTRTSANEIVHPLTLAAAMGRFDSIVLLVSCGGDVNTSDYFGIRRKTLFDRALRGDDLKICEFLLCAGAVVDRNALQSFYSKMLWSSVCANDVNAVLHLPLQQISINQSYCDWHEGFYKTVLGKAIELGNPSMIAILMKGGATDDGAIYCIPEIETAKYLNSVGLLPRVLRSGGQNILYTAILAGNDALMEYLLHSSTGQMGQIEVSRQGPFMHQRINPMEAAIRCDKLDILDALLVRDFPLTDDVLTEAVERDFKRNEHLFLRLIADRRSLLKFKAPRAISKAVKMRNKSLVKTLLDLGVDPRRGSFSKHSTVLEKSEIMDDQDLFQMLFMSAEWSAEELGRCFTASIWYGQSEIMLYLHDFGVDLHQRSWIDNKLRHPLEITIEKEDVSLVRTLIDYGCNPNESEYLSKTGTLLRYAAEKGNMEILNLLLDAGPVPDGEGDFYAANATKALQVAARAGNMEVVKKLLNAGADVNSAPESNCGATALQFAAMYGFIGILRRLLEEGADVNAGRAPQRGRTALEGAAEHGRIGILQLLLDHGALIDGKGRRQYIRAVKLAEWNAHSALAKFLRAHGGWTELDSQRARLEKYEPFKNSEPDYENDLVWNYGFFWDSMSESD